MTTWIAAAMSLVGILIGATLQYAFNRHIESRKVLAAQKALAYTDFFKAVADLSQDRNAGLLASAADAKTRICLFAVKEVVQALARFEAEGSLASSAAGQQALLCLLNAMRRDLLGPQPTIPKKDVLNLLFGAQSRPLGPENLSSLTAKMTGLESGPK